MNLNEDIIDKGVDKNSHTEARRSIDYNALTEVTSIMLITFHSTTQCDKHADFGFVLRPI